MASEADASCESDPNFAIICAFMEKFGELCGIGSIDFVELQNMLENNQEVSPELMNLHIKLLRKTKKNVTVERWERALVNMCHKYSSKDAWEIERFGYKKTRLQVKLRALKELLEMQFDYHTKFKNEVNKLSAESLRAQPLGRDKLGRAYWYQTDNNYQIRIYKEDPDEETWHLVAKDRDGLVSLMNELTDGDSKISSDSALNEDSNSLSEKPFIDTGQLESSNESKQTERDTEKSDDNLNNDSESPKEGPISQIPEKELVDSEDIDKIESDSKDKETQQKDDDVQNDEDISDDEEIEEDTDEKKEEELDSLEVKRPMLRIKSLSELMDSPKQTKKTNLLTDLPELTIIKKPKLNTSQITITKKFNNQPSTVEVSSAIESPVMMIKGEGSGYNNESCDIVSKEIDEPVMYIPGSKDKVIVSEEIEEEVMFIVGEGSGSCCETGNRKPSVADKNKSNTPSKSEKLEKLATVTSGSHIMKKEDIIVSEAIEEEVMFIFGEGSGRDCETGNEKEQAAATETDKSKNTDPNLKTIENPNKVPIDSVNLETMIDLKTDTGSDTDATKKEETFSTRKVQFFFGPGSLNTKPSPLSPVTHASSSEETLLSEVPEKNNGSVSKDKSEEKEENNECSAENTVKYDKNVDEMENTSENGKNDNTEGNSATNLENKTSNEEAKDLIAKDAENIQIEEEHAPEKQEDDHLELNIAEKEIGNDENEVALSKKSDTNFDIDEGGSFEKDKINPVQEEIEERQSLEKTEDTTQEKLDAIEERNVEDGDVVKNIDENKKQTMSEETEEKLKKAEEIVENVDIIESEENIVEDKGKNVEVLEENTKEAKDIIEKEDENIKEDVENIQADQKNVEKEKNAEKDEDNKISNKHKENTERDEIITEQDEKNSHKDEEIIEKDEEQIENKDNVEFSREKKEDDKSESLIDNTEKNDQHEVTETQEDITNIANPIDDEEDSENIEEYVNKDQEKDEELKNQGTASKRKRTTRNTAASVQSINEDENMHPRKKIPVDKPKKRGPQKATVTKDAEDDEKDDTAETAPTVEISEPRSTRQMRQTRATPAKKQVPIAPPKAKGKLKKTTSQSSKSDEVDSPVPLESVTIVDTDNSNTATENPEKDPLAVSEEELSSVNPAIPSITSFSFDYNPDSPAPEEAKRSLRKRGRDNMEDKPDASEKGVKRPKMKGKRVMDQSLRKNVEEKRQQVTDGSSDENELLKMKVKVTKAAKKVPVKKKAGTPSVSDSDNTSQKSVKRGRPPKNARILKNLGVKEEELSSITESQAPVRQSRRLAQIKIKEEATMRRADEDDISSKKKKKKSDDKDFKVGKRKRIEEEVKPAPTPPMVEKKKKKKNKQNKISIGWKSSSEDSDNSGPEEEEVSEYEEHHEEEPLQFKSDHEFSPESDLECDEPLPLKRARTVRKEESDGAEEPEEEFPCQKCGKSDHPEWILLCDKCDNGWHCSCLRPPLFVIPEGDWYCPSCQHESLLENLNKKLVDFDKMMVKKEMEDRRKERLAYVGISLNNVLPAKEKKEKKSQESSDSEETSRENTPSGSDSNASDSDEPIYQLRQRRQAHSYKFQDYDDLINSALDEVPPPQVEKTHTLSRGKDIATIVNAAKEEEEKNGFEDLPPVVPRDPEENRKKAMSYRKKPKRLNNLEVNSDDEADDSDEDFKGSSSGESDEEEYTDDSDDSFVGKKSSRPVRRSTRARTTRFDADFINDDSDEAPSKKKKKKRYFSDSESSLSDDDWGGRKKKSNKSFGHKKSKKKKVFDDSDLENYRKKKPKIKYGMDSEDDTRGRRTRGKKTSYLDTLGSDSEEETLKKKIKDKSDDEYVAEDDEEKESEEEVPGVDKSSGDEDEDFIRRKQQKSSDDSEDEVLVKKVKQKTKRAIMDSEDEEEEKKPEKPEKKKESPKLPDKNQIINEELAKTVREFDEQVPLEPKTISDVQPIELQKPTMVSGLNVEKLKACGITVTKVAKDKVGMPPSVENEETPRNLMEIGAKPSVPVLSQKTITPVNLAKIDKSLDELDEEEVEEMMENEEYANRQLELAAIQIREAKRLKELQNKEASKLPPTILKKPTEIFPKKQTTGRFFNMKPPQESMLGNSSLVMNDDDNDELSEPPGVTLPLFSELGSMKAHNLSKSNNSSRSPLNNTPPPPSSPNRAIPVPLLNMPMGGPHPLSGNIPMVPPNSFGLSRPTGMMHHMRPTRLMGPRGGHIPPMMGPRGHMPQMEPSNLIMRPNVPGNISNMPPNVSNMPGSISNVARNMGVPPMSSNIKMGTSAPVPISSSAPMMANPHMGPMSSVAASVPVGINMTMSPSMTMASNMSMGPNAHAGSSPNINVGSGGPAQAPNQPNDSPESALKKRRGRGKGKKTLAAEAAAAAAASGGLPETNKPAGSKPPVANIEIASPPQPFSQSQPAPSVITRMLQTTPGKGAFPVGRIRPKQFAMMQDSDDSDGSRPAESQEKDVAAHPAPVASHPPVSASHGSHPAGHYGPPPGQYPPNFYPKDGQPQPPHGYQRLPPHPIQPYSSHPPQPQMDQPPMSAPIHQPPINMADPPAIGQYSAPPPPAKSPYEGIPPHRSSYPNSNPGYNYDYNVPPSVMAEEGVPPPYDNPTTYPDQYETGHANVDSGVKNAEEESSGEFGGLVSYFSSQHDNDLEQ